MKRGSKDHPEILRTPQPTSTIVLTATPDNSSSLQITSFKLSGRNFLAWSQSVQLVIRGKGKFGYLDGSISQSKPTDPSFPAWDINNSMVMSWILNSMDNSIAKIYLLYPIAKAIWDVVTVAYSDLKDSSQMFHLHNRCRLLHQGELSVTQYFNTLTKLWQELDLFNAKEWHDPKDATIYRNFSTRERTYDFLTGLDRSLDDICGRILNVKPLPLIDEIFVEVRREESRKHVMLVRFLLRRKL